jgi:hypothetical protein
VGARVLADAVATFAQAISRTSPTMHISTISAAEKLLRSCE